MLINQVRRFGEALVDRHVLSRDSLESAIEEAERTNQTLHQRTIAEVKKVDKLASSHAAE